MELAEYSKCVSELPYGKRLPSAVYLFWEDGLKLGEAIDSLVARAKAAFGITDQFNVIKFRTDELKLSFLWYPEFLTEAHLALQHAVTVDLVRGKARRMDYAGNSNPPVLHRKETFLPAEPQGSGVAEFYAFVA